MAQETDNNKMDNNDNLNQSLHLGKQYIFMPIHLICCKSVGLYASSAGWEKYYTIRTDDSCRNQLSVNDKKYQHCESSFHYATTLQ